MITRRRSRTHNTRAHAHAQAHAHAHTVLTTHRKLQSNPLTFVMGHGCRIVRFSAVFEIEARPTEVWLLS